MKKVPAIAGSIVIFVSALFAEPVSLSGMVKDADGTALAGVSLSLAKIEGLSVVSNAQGVFSLAGTGVRKVQCASVLSHARIRISGTRLFISSLPAGSPGSIAIFSSDGRRVAFLQFQGNDNGLVTAALPQLTPGLHLLRLTAGEQSVIRTLLSQGISETHLINSTEQNAVTSSLTKHSTVTAVDTIRATKTGYVDALVPVDSYNIKDIEIVMHKEGEPGGELPLVYGVENTGAACQKPTLLAKVADYPVVTNLPDPFLMADGKTRMTTRAQWKCRRAEINAIIQKFQLGTKPELTSEDNLTADFSGGTLTVKVTHGGHSITLTSRLSIPSGTGPFPLIIALGMSNSPSNGSLPDLFSSNNIAKAGFDATQLAPQSDGTRGKGNFFKLYPDKTVGDYAAWAWGFSRIVDGIFKTAAQTKIDTTKLAVTGCSWAGKGALMLGALDERIALTLPQESGGGGEAAWRVMADNTGMEDLEHAQGVAWYAQSLKDVKNSMAKNCPWDNHELLALVAPRAVYVIGNPDMEYLGSKAGYISCLAAKEVWKALGVPDRMGFGYIGNHGHCSDVPAGNKKDLEAFVKKFLLGDKSANTSNIAVWTNVKSSMPTAFTASTDKYITWDAPELK
ncbi:MAG: carboxypeptidase regulatory-like domain-containing protein [Chitinispirillaceae bacterium]|nr:carboxypeptidase regulatory-like domain-containing protein [Chitinispirillaceae bacterium]